MTEPAVAKALALVAPAETAFTSRWRLSTLEKLDPELHKLLEEQRGLYDYALLAGSARDIETQSEAMVRGWRAACQRLEHPLQPDDAYFIGTNLDTCTRVCIGYHKQSAARVQRIEGRDVYFVTPDEVAAMLASYRMLRDIKDRFPDAELLNVRTENNMDTVA